MITTELDRKARAYDNAARQLTNQGADEDEIEFEEIEEAVGKSVRAYCEGIGYSDKYYF